MNHPLPRSPGSPVSYEFVSPEPLPALPVSAAAAPTIIQAKAEPGASPVRRLREQMSMAPESDDPYEAYRQRILQAQAERADHVRRTMPPLPAQALTDDALDKLSQRNYFYDPQQYYARAIEAVAPAQEPFFKSGIWNRGLAMASVVAIAAGATVGFALTKKEEIGASATRTLAYVGALLPADQPARPVIADASPPTSSTTIAKKPIATATLDVADVTGSLNSAIALQLRADPAFAEQDLSIRLSGLPLDAVLTPGRKIADQTWVLNDEDLANARLVVPHADAAVFDVSVAAIETSTGELAAPVREMKLALTGVPAAQKTEIQPAAANQSVVAQLPATMPEQPLAAAARPPVSEVQITPASAAPEAPGSIARPSANAMASPIPPAVAPTVVAPPPSPIASGLLQKGDVLFKAGDLMMARQFYLRALDLGAAEGALGVARTYDPAVFKELKVEGLVPDVAQAREWYRKASLTGLPEAVSALARFETTAALPQ